VLKYGKAHLGKEIEMNLFFWGIVVQTLGLVCAIVAVVVTGEQLSAIPFVAVLVVGAAMVLTDIKLESDRNRRRRRN